MRSWRCWPMQVVLLLGLGTVVAQAADKETRSRYPKAPTETESNKWDWANPMKWFGSKEKEKPAEGKSKKKDSKKLDAPTLLSPMDEAATRRAREEAELFRRLAAVDELRAIAQRRNDAAMLQEVEEIERKAMAIFSQRTGARTPLDAGGAEAGLARDADALLRRKPGDEPVYSVTTDRGKPRNGTKEVDR